MALERVSDALSLLQIETLRMLLALHKNEFSNWPSRKLMEADLEEHYGSFDLLLNDLTREELSGLCQRYGLKGDGPKTELIDILAKAKAFPEANAQGSSIPMWLLALLDLLTIFKR